MIAMGPIIRSRKSCLVTLLIGCLILIRPAVVEAGNWRVSPIKLFFNAQNHTEVITVTNDGDQPLNLVISAAQWSQDQEGKDLYQPATDLIFFPKQLKVEPKRERVIRAGIRNLPATREKTYRIFIREIPEKKPDASNTVAIAIQFGVPVFVAPPREVTKGVISDAAVSAGKVHLKVQNQGNDHFRIDMVKLQGVSASGEVVYTKELEGWYLLSGSSRAFSADIPTDACRRSDTLDIQVNADRITLNGKIDVDKAMCSVP